MCSLDSSIEESQGGFMIAKLIHGSLWLLLFLAVSGCATENKEKDGAVILLQKGQDDSRHSPFGIFGPYQFMWDSQNVMTHGRINQYLLDLGITWVQEMPPGIGDVPESIHVYSRVGREAGTIPPKVDYPAYIKELRALIRQHHNRVKYWEIDTEPGGLSPPRGWVGFEKEYAEFLKKTHGVIKEECPDCLVVMGGAGGIAGGRREDINAAFVRSILAYGAGAYFDVFSFKLHHHKAADYVDLKNKMEIFEQLFREYHIDLQKKMIFLETGIYDGDPHYAQGHSLSFIHLPLQTESRQASGLVKTYLFAIAQGVDKIFWNEVLERYNFGGETRNPFNYYGLVNNPLNFDGKSHKKLAYYSYKKMIETLDGSDWKNLVKVEEGQGRCIYRLNRRGRVLWVAWNDGPEKTTVHIPGLRSSAVRVTYAVPQVSSGHQIQDYQTAFREEILYVKDNGISLLLEQDTPVYIRELD